MRIKDNSSITKEDCTEISGIIKKIANKTLDQLEKEGVFVFPRVVNESEDITKDQMVLQGFNGTFRTGNVMGFLGLGDERLTIESRFSKGEDDYFFQYLLERVLDFPNVVNLETDANQDERLFSLLLFLFPQYLRAAARKGIFKIYIRSEYNDDNVRGAIDVSRHIKKNIPFVGNIAYAQREHSFDNYLIELIRHTIEFIKKKSYGGKVLESVKDEVKLIVEATNDYKPSDRFKIIEQNKKNKVRHAYYHEYRDLQQLCLLILRNEQHKLGAGSKKVFGILFDGAWLWEEYVNILIGEKFYHPMNKGGKGSQWLFTGELGLAGLIYPDFIGKDPDNRIIADAKYKPVDNIGNKDYLQVLAYMLRFDSDISYYLYPEAGNNDDLVLELNQGMSYEKNVRARGTAKVIKHGLKIPQNVECYESFVNEIRIQEEAFKEVLL